MIRLGLRLALAGGREAAARLTAIGLAVALGLVLLISTLAAVPAFFAQNERLNWLDSGAAASDSAPAAGVDPVWWRLGYDLYDGHDVARLDVAVTGPHGPVPPGLAALPAAGQFYASPALTQLLRTVPAEQLADRYPGTLVGTIGPAALQSPDSLMVIIGHDPAELAGKPQVSRVTQIMAAARCAGCGVGVGGAGVDLVVGSVAGGLLFPLLIFIGTATRMSAARREERFAAMRLVGATPGQISRLATVEAMLAAGVGTVLGFGLFLALRSQLAKIPFTGDRFFVADFWPPPWQAAVLAVTVPVAAALAARVALRRVRISPLGVSRRFTPRPPRAYRLLPLIAGVAGLALLIGHRPSTPQTQTQVYLAGFLLVMIGLLVAGPWLTGSGARVLARWARRPAGLIAARRLADHPQAGFRAVSGLMLALFVTSVATGIIGGITAERGAAAVPATARGTLSMVFWTDPERPGQQLGPAPVPAGLADVPGVRGVLVIRANPAWRPDSPQPDGLVACGELAMIPAVPHCTAGVAVAALPATVQGTRGAPLPPVPVPGLDRAALAGLPVLSIKVYTDAGTAAVERARTRLEVAYPGAYPPSQDREFNNAFTNTLAGWQRLADVLTVASLVIAGTGLAVVVLAGLNERRRPFSLLRLTGVPVGVLRRVVLLESGVPLLAAAVLATGTGLLAAHLFLRAQLGYSLHPPGGGFYLTVGLGLAVSLGVIMSTLPVLRRITGPAAARNG